ncbi:UNVERIFIED_CONTAM: hypothetical protein PYX00_005212 [Menopon gallinae]
MVDTEGERRVKPLIKLISEVYDNPNAYEIFEMELDRALEEGIDVIVIEPTRLGDETARWIAFGNYLHKTAVLAGMGSIATAFIWTDRPYFCLPLGIISILCTSIYTLSWQFDPCVKYQVETDFKKLLADYPQLSHLSTSPVVLVRKDNSRRRMLHSGISLIATIFCIWRLYDTFI